MKKNDRCLDFLDHSVIDSFREVINSSAMFSKGENCRKYFNLICTFMDRIDDSVRYLNGHASLPQTEEDFINFMVHATILRDGVKRIFEKVFRETPLFSTDKKFFCHAKLGKEPFFSEDTCPTDDVFFEYLRAMVFAHPFDTTGRTKERPFLSEGEMHFCPFVIVARECDNFFDINDAVGIRIYSNKDMDKVGNVTISFSWLKEYIKSRYESIASLTERAKSGILSQQETWKQNRLDRNQHPAEIFREIVSTLKDRFEDSYTAETALADLECNLSDERNQDNVAIYRDTIVAKISVCCDCIENLDYEGFEEALSFIYVRPQNMHETASYQLEKIFSYLDQRSVNIDPFSNEAWGLCQARAFSRNFAKKWVTIDVGKMPYDEIKLLVRVACFLEYREQND